MIREVLRYPHPALKQVARALEPGEDEEIARVAADLVDTMDSFGHCVGLAATQLGEMVRMIVVDVTGQSYRLSLMAVPLETSGAAKHYVLTFEQHANAKARSAASLDGAGPFQQFRKITIPAIRPTIVFTVNNVGAATVRPGGFASITDEDWQASWDLNVMGIVLTSDAPGRQYCTQAPSLLNNATVPSGLRAPTATTGTREVSPRPAFGAKAAG